MSLVYLDGNLIEGSQAAEFYFNGKLFRLVSGSTDTTPPTITSRNNIRLVPGQSLTLALTASETVTWAKTGGANSASFTLTGSTLTLPGQPGRATRVVQVTATDTAGNPTNQTITVTTTDRKRRARGLTMQ